MNRMDEMEHAYQAHADSVYRYLYSLCREEQLAEELTQETFFQAVKSVGRFDRNSSPRLCIFRYPVCGALCLRRCRFRNCKSEV